MTTGKQDRKPHPPKHLIAAYWLKREPHFVIDYGEPACFACGWYQPSWVTKFSTDGTFNARLTWDQTKYQLEVAHLIPHMLDGSAETDNLVLLCRECHHQAPSYRNPEVILQWMQEREHYSCSSVILAEQMMRRLPVFIDYSSLADAILADEFHKFATERIGYSPAETREAFARSCIAAVEEYALKPTGVV